MRPKPRAASTPPPSHFLCLPLASAQLSRTLGAFRNDVTGAQGFALPHDAVRPTGTIHLTLGVMSLADPHRLSQALDLLASLRPREVLEALGRGPSLLPSRPGYSSSCSSVPSPPSSSSISSPTTTLHLSLTGLHPMTSPAKTSVLYASPKHDQLHAFCQEMRMPFVEAGLMTHDGRPLLLHATLVNTVYVKTRRRGGGDKVWLDARDLLVKYGDHVWAEGLAVDKLALCKMGAKKVDDGDEKYEVVGEVQF